MTRLFAQILCTVILLANAVMVFASQPSPYAGQEERKIKALSASDIDAYLNGKGMGFAKAAELNHYPGPRHVLDLADKLALSNTQHSQTQALFNEMKQQAVSLGERLVAKESELEGLFSANKITPEDLKKVLSEIGEIRSNLRYVHLNAHLKQKKILSTHQAMLYDKIRGYGTDKKHDHNHEH